MRPSDIGALAQLGLKFRARLAELKAGGSADFSWYPYDSIANLLHLDKLLKGTDRDVLALAGAGPVLDLCCGDGDLAMFFETQGCTVHAVDWPMTNANFMRGVKFLRKGLSSSVEVHERDLDSRFDLPGPHYTAAFFFGGLYHLKNPYYVLEKLAHQAKYCFFSTRVAKFTPDHKARIENYPLAYLVGPDDVNSDSTNYWIFSVTGLRQVVERAGWSIRALTCSAPELASDPIRPERDERAFCLLESQYFKGHPLILQRDGWHELEDQVWRWTGSRFGLTVEGLATRPYRLRLPLTVPEAVVARAGKVHVSLDVDGRRAQEACYGEPGDFVFESMIEAQAEPSTFCFTVQGALPPDAADPRERGVIVKPNDLRSLLTHSS